MQKLIYSSAVTGILCALVLIYMVWFEPSETLAKSLVTLGILFIAQIVVYLVMRDIQEEASGKDDGSIAK
jgi:uncharacterized membrane protein